MIPKIKKDAKKVLEAILGEPAADIYTAGNGGSASIAAHMETDLSKAIFEHGGLYPRITCLVTNMPLLTMIANDYGYDQTISWQIRSKGLGGDILILISSSGKSKNIVEAAKIAKKQRLTVIGFTGFNGGELKNLADISIHCDSEDYGEIEDYHSQVMHEVVRQLRELE